MLLIVLLTSITLIIVSKTTHRFLNLSNKFRATLLFAGMFGLGFFAGFSLYAHIADFLTGFWAGMSANKN